MKIRCLLRKLKKIVLNLYYKILRKIKPAPFVYDTDETLKTIIEKNASMARYGDGELNLIVGNSIDFQDYSSEISNRLQEVLAYDDEKFLVGLPDTFRRREDLILKTREFWEQYHNIHWKQWKKFIKKGKKYYDACVTRFYLSYIDKTKSEKILKQWRKVWDKKKIVIVEGKDSKLGVGNDLFINASSIRRIICPTHNAFNVYSKILKSIKDNCSVDELILIALGPTATVLAFDLYKMGYWALDIGHIDIEYEWMLMNATEKQNVTGKFTNEAIGEKLEGSIQDKFYNDQIIDQINQE